MLEPQWLAWLIMFELLFKLYECLKLFQFFSFQVIYCNFLTLLKRTYCDNRTSHLSHLSTFSSHLTVIIGEAFLPLLFSSTSTKFCKVSCLHSKQHSFATIPKRPVHPPAMIPKALFQHCFFFCVLFFSFFSVEFLLEFQSYTNVKITFQWRSANSNNQEICSHCMLYRSNSPIPALRSCNGHYPPCALCMFSQLQTCCSLPWTDNLRSEFIAALFNRCS